MPETACKHPGKQHLWTRVAAKVGHGSPCKVFLSLAVQTDTEDTGLLS